MTITTSTGQIHREGITEVSRLWLQVKRDTEWDDRRLSERFAVRGEPWVQERNVDPAEITEALLDLSTMTPAELGGTTVTLDLSSQSARRVHMVIRIETAHTVMTYTGTGREL